MISYHYVSDAIIGAGCQRSRIYLNLPMFRTVSDIREFKQLPRLLRQKRHIKIELCIRLSVLRFFHVGHFEQNRRSVLSLAWHE